MIEEVEGTLLLFLRWTTVLSLIDKIDTHCVSRFRDKFHNQC